MSLVLPGWDCTSCRVFNGEAKMRLEECRSCGAPRPVLEEETMLKTLTIAQARCTELLLENRALKARVAELEART
jgi:hypothetical protein